MAPISHFQWLPRLHAPQDGAGMLLKRSNADLFHVRQRSTRAGSVKPLAATPFVGTGRYT